MANNTYQVLRSLTHDGKEYPSGSTVSLSDAQTANLINLDPPVIQLVQKGDKT